MHYIYLSLAIVLEVLGSSFMKLSDGFTKPLFAIGTAVAYIACFYILSLSLRVIPLGVAYAIWAAVGLILTNVVSVIFFKQHFDLAAGIGISLIVAGVIIINVFSSASAH